jgi:hypothetical protein
METGTARTREDARPDLDVVGWECGRAAGRFEGATDFAAGAGCEDELNSGGSHPEGWRCARILEEFRGSSSPDACWR